MSSFVLPQQAIRALLYHISAPYPHCTQRQRAHFSYLPDIRGRKKKVQSSFFFIIRPPHPVYSCTCTCMMKRPTSYFCAMECSSSSRKLYAKGEGGAGPTRLSHCPPFASPSTLAGAAGTADRPSLRRRGKVPV
ncbi:hypothetical protein BS50DRAFT_296346 [Corynespora cassiicola Philippines]|uniref:Uncharacterized protein n=1 Tax=Corynespora cassiicola Philippines TaxID=1448308 RepID=A0A2T2NWI5_CORCC|nr:hypothetical protein BS50DRAFT_296346 [Corynespora cassiicola Philippines]